MPANYIKFSYIDNWYSWRTPRTCRAPVAGSAAESRDRARRRARNIVSRPHARELFVGALAVPPEAHLEPGVAHAVRHATTEEVVVAKVRNILVLACLFTATIGAQGGFWSAAGFTGVVDKSSLSSFIFNDAGSVSIRSGVSSGVVKLRYPVLGGPASTPGGDTAFCMRLSVRDTGASARVIATLKAIRASDGAQITLGTFDTDASFNPVTPSDQYQMFSSCDIRDPQSVTPLNGFDYLQFDYYIEVQLIKTDSTGNPGIKHLGMYIG
jgi:hypothetical protein